MSRARSRKRRPRGGRGVQREGASQAHRDSGPSEGGRASEIRPGGPTSDKVNVRARGVSARPATGSSATRRSRSSPTAPTFGEHPRAPWHPLPLSELLILAGAVGTVLGMKRLGHGLSSGGPTLLVGLAVVAIGTIEVTLREHRSGYRSHTVLLAVLPVLVLDSLVVLGVSAFATPPRLLTVGLLAVDIALVALLFKVLRARFLEARHARVLSSAR